VLQIRNLRVKSFVVDHLDLFWEIEDTVEDPLDYAFLIERSESPGGPWDQISQEFSDKYWYRDIRSLPFHRWRNLFYRIKVRNIQTAAETYSDFVMREPRANLEAMEVRRLETLLFQEHIGRVVFVFPVRTFGQRCPNCFDKVTGAKLRANCVDCYGKGYTRGYLSPILSRLQIDPSPKHTNMASTGETQEQNSTGRLPFFPPLKPHDVLVEAENRRWEVVSISSTERLRATLHQEFVIHELPHSDIVYKLPVNLDELRTFEADPPRTFTNLQTLEAMLDPVVSEHMLLGWGNR
jgi:hypothetical protein